MGGNWKAQPHGIMLLHDAQMIREEGKKKRKRKTIIFYKEKLITNFGSPEELLLIPILRRLMRGKKNSPIE